MKTDDYHIMFSCSCMVLNSIAVVLGMHILQGHIRFHVYHDILFVRFLKQKTLFLFRQGSLYLKIMILIIT